MSEPQTYRIRISRDEAWELVVFQSFPGDFDQLGLETIAGELSKDTKTRAWASVGSVNSPGDSDAHQTLKMAILRERSEAKYQKENGSHSVLGLLVGF